MTLVQSSAALIVGLVAFVLVLSITIWEAFIPKEVHFYGVFATTIKPPWAYVVGGCFLVLNLFIIFVVIILRLYIVGTCKFALSCMGGAYIFAFQQPALWGWCFIMVGYFVLWRLSLRKSAAMSTEKRALPRDRRGAISRNALMRAKRNSPQR